MFGAIISTSCFSVVRQFSSSSKSVFRNPKFMGLSGSSRSGSLNSMLVTAASAVAIDAGAEVNIIDLNQYLLPVFSEDIEKDVPYAAKDLKSAFLSCDGFIIASPEYNGSLTPLLCNTLAWMSRTLGEKEEMYAAFKGKHALILAASPGALGGLRSLPQVRAVLNNLGTNVIASQVAVGSAYKVLKSTDAGIAIESDQIKSMIQGAVGELVEVSRDSVNRKHTCDLIREVYGQYGNIVLQK